MQIQLLGLMFLQLFLAFEKAINPSLCLNCQTTSYCFGFSLYPITVSTKIGSGAIFVDSYHFNYNICPQEVFILVSSFKFFFKASRHLRQIIRAQHNPKLLHQNFYQLLCLFSSSLVCPFIISNSGYHTCNWSPNSFRNRIMCPNYNRFILHFGLLDLEDLPSSGKVSTKRRSRSSNSSHGEAKS